MTDRTGNQMASLVLVGCGLIAIGAVIWTARDQAVAPGEWPQVCRVVHPEDLASPSGP